MRLIDAGTPLRRDPVWASARDGRIARPNPTETSSIETSVRSCSCRLPIQWHGGRDAVQENGNLASSVAVPMRAGGPSLLSLRTQSGTRSDFNSAEPAKSPSRDPPTPFSSSGNLDDGRKPLLQTRHTPVMMLLTTYDDPRMPYRVHYCCR